jgi:hypothetical protein
MPDDLLARACDQAERSEPSVRAAALLRIARVLSAHDPVEARSTFHRALNEAQQLSGRDREFLIEQAQQIAAAIAPDLLSQISSAGPIPRHFMSETLGKIMLDHGHTEAAFEYLMHYAEPSSFPFGVVSHLMQSVDEERRLALLRRAIEAWRTGRADQFVWLFQWQWKVLPLDEARAVAQEIVRVALERPDAPVTASYDREGNVQMTSGREHRLFQILHILRHVDPPLAESLIAGHEQLAAAAVRFPNGMESVMEEAAAHRKQAQGATGGGYIIGGDPRDFPFMKALMQASQDADFGPPFEHALERYREDVAPERPNLAPREFWPSTRAFRDILYRAGKRLGPAAAAYLDRVPDDDLRLFAQIELAAALAGLPELPGTQREYRGSPGPRSTI